MPHATRAERLGMATRRRLLLSASTALVCVFLTGCGGPSVDEQVVVPPAALSLSPAADVVYECLTAKGWEVTISWEGGIESSSEAIPQAQLDRYEDDEAACWSIIDERVQSMSSDAIAEVYEAELATRDCLREQGLDVSEPPSQQQYVDTFHGERWMAYAASDIDSVASDPAAWRRIAQACPQPSWSLGAE